MTTAIKVLTQATKARYGDVTWYVVKAVRYEAEGFSCIRCLVTQTETVARRAEARLERLLTEGRSCAFDLVFFTETDTDGLVSTCLQT